MLGSHGVERKQKPWEESVCVPFLLHYPALLGSQGRTVDAPIAIVDMMPTLLGLCGLSIPETVEGLDYSDYIQGGPDPSDGAALIACYHAFGEWHKGNGGKEYRGLRSDRYTYVRDLQGPWMLYDRQADPYQLHNLVDTPAYAEVRAALNAQLQGKLAALDDEFRPGMEYIRQWNYTVDETGTVPYHFKFPAA
jgi:arylsulfatase A-like enzyme